MAIARAGLAGQERAESRVDEVLADRVLEQRRPPRRSRPAPGRSMPARSDGPLEPDQPVPCRQLLGEIDAGQSVLEVTPHPGLGDPSWSRSACSRASRRPAGPRRARSDRGWRSSPRSLVVHERRGRQRGPHVPVAVSSSGRRAGCATARRRWRHSCSVVPLRRALVDGRRPPAGSGRRPGRWARCDASSSASSRGRAPRSGSTAMKHVDEQLRPAAGPRPRCRRTGAGASDQLVEAPQLGEQVGVRSARRMSSAAADSATVRSS